ncbi:CaiB/BaiF CoA transferase family protein [Streptomyces uncialis]|uniref:Carnitine dehydratase n=1 Tax=Streptomyces uncialis TaxID=1048205 RepID=A0A1Q4V885_9ACTN|nr:CoA transferase [Streptomyces uncialis]OKH94046.1 carnitine dehydratase [Streptomyces uncialis]
MSGPLDGILVADFSRVLAGPLCTMTLADLGATVVKVERPGSGDDTRAWGPPWSATSTTYFDSVNRSKLGIALDLTDDTDRALGQELAHRADVVVENFRTGSLDRLGLGYERVSAVNPGVVYCSITGFGGGAGAGLLGYDFVVQAVGGLMSVTGETDGDPAKAGVALVDVLTGKDAVIGVLAALAGRARTGRGCRVEVDLLSSLLGSLVNQAQGFLETGRPPGRMGNRHPSIAPYETLRCRDGLLAVACGNDGQFARLATALGAAALADDARFRTNAARVGHREELVAALEERLAHGDAADWQTRLTGAGVPAGRVGTIADGFALAEELGLSPTVAPAGGGTPTVRHPVTYSTGPVREPSPPPRLDEHGDAVRAWLAGPGGEPLPSSG